MKSTLIITGAANGLGREILARYSHQYRVIAIDVDKKSLDVIGKTFDVDTLVADITDYDTLEKKLQNLLNPQDSIDLLVNCAGIYVDGPLEQNSPSLINKVINVNVLGTINLCRFVVPLMKRQKKGLIINIVSQAAFTGKANFSVYHASKWGVAGFTKSLQLELYPEGVRVTGIYPGLLDTNFVKNATQDRSQYPPIKMEDMIKTIEFVINQPDDIVIPEIGIRRINSF